MILVITLDFLRPESKFDSHRNSRLRRRSRASLNLIRKSLEAARRQYAPRSKADWTGTFYQYANRLAFHHFLSRTNGLKTRLVFLAFTNAADVEGPVTEEEWHGATRLLHAALGLPADLSARRVHHAFIDARALTDAR